MRLIDADKLNKPIYAEEDNITGAGMSYDEMCGYNDGIDIAWNKIDQAPTVDAVPIIHCKDCVYFHPYPFEPTYGSCKYHLAPDLQWEEKKETDYCSDVEELKDD